MVTFNKRYGVSEWDGQCSVPVSKYNKICIVTTCMNRVADLATHMPANLQSMISYPNLEYNIIDYKDGGELKTWVKTNMMEYIERGIVNYYQVIDDHIKFYSMSHSRNIGFRLAGGINNISHDIIVQQVDADNTITPQNETPYNFAEYLNIMAHQIPNNAIFIKSYQRNHGRIGVYKDEFVNIIGGYCEELQGYGSDDTIVFDFATKHKNFIVGKYTGTYAQRTWTDGKDKSKNLEVGDWKLSERINEEKMKTILARNPKSLNDGKTWGNATVIKNFTETFTI